MVPNNPHSSHLQSNLTNAVSYNYNKANWSSFSLFIHNKISIVSSNTNSYAIFTDIIESAAKSSIPVHSTKRKKYPPSPPWWNASCTDAIKNRSSLYKAFRHSGLIADFLNYHNACARTTFLLKNVKRNAWEETFCSNLNPTSSIHSLWHTAKCYKKCVFPVVRPNNDDWFNDFCSKVAPSCVPTFLEACPSICPLPSSSHILTNPFT